MVSWLVCMRSLFNILEHFNSEHCTPRLGASRSVILPTLDTSKLGESACRQANLADNGFFLNWVAGIAFWFVNLKVNLCWTFTHCKGQDIPKRLLSKLAVILYPRQGIGDAFVQDPNYFRVCCACSSAHEPLGTCFSLQLLRDPPSSVMRNSNPFD